MVRLLITMGDPAGIGPEVLLHSLKTLRSSARITVIGDLAFLKRLSISRSFPWSRYRWIDLNNCPVRLKRGAPHPQAGRAAFAYCQEAVEELRAGRADAWVTGPVSKEAIVQSGIRWVGHTEYLGQQWKVKPVMMFSAGFLRISLVTTHLPIRQLSRKISAADVERVCRASWEGLRRDFKIRSPRLGLAALNPHAGDGGLFGSEEQRILKPVVTRMRGKVTGPIPVDVLMQQAAAGRWDGVVALYHDQALIPIKLTQPDKAVNVTLGLPFVRTSPVHGTAFDLVGKKSPSAASMRTAVEMALSLAQHRRVIAGSELERKVPGLRPGTCK